MSEAADERGPTREQWARRYADGDTPWHVEGGHPELRARVRSGELAPRSGHDRAFVPGCGRGHDAFVLAEAGWRVTAVDLVETFADEIRTRLGARGGEFVAGNALECQTARPFDLIWEHTFFCAIPPRDRARYGETIRRVSAPGSRVAVLVFPIGRPLDQAGPPWGVTTQDYADALGDEFTLEQDGMAAHKLPRRSWGERYALFRR